MQEAKDFTKLYDTTYPLNVHLEDQKRTSPAAIKKNHDVQTPVRDLVAYSYDAPIATVLDSKTNLKAVRNRSSTSSQDFAQQRHRR